jgi:hypothetical protein
MIAAGFCCQTKKCLKLYETMFIPRNKCRYTCLRVISWDHWDHILKKMSIHPTIPLINMIFATLSAFSDCHAGHVMLVDYESRLPYKSRTKVRSHVKLVLPRLGSARLPARLGILSYKYGSERLIERLRAARAIPFWS